MNTPHTSDSVAAPTISDEHIEFLTMLRKAMWGGEQADMIDAIILRLRSASAAPVKGVAQAVDAVTKLLLEIDEYLSGHPQNAIHSGSKLHQSVKYVLSKAPAAEAPTGEITDREIEDALNAMEMYAIQSAARPADYQAGWHSWSCNSAFAGKLAKYIRALRTDTAPGLPAQAAKPPTCGVTITEDEREALERITDECEQMVPFITGSKTDRDMPGALAQLKADIRGLRNLADRLSKGERGRGEAPLSRGDPA